MRTNTGQQSGRGVITTAAVALVLTATMVMFLISGSGSGEVSKADYREALISKLTDDGRLTIPSNLTSEQRDYYLTCLTQHSYPRVSEDARAIVVADHPLQELHDSDFEIIVFQALDCKDVIAAERDKKAAE